MARTTRYDTVSQFPSDIDDLLFLDDINLEELSQVQRHKDLLAAEQYTAAGEYLEQNVTFDCFCASLFNLMVNRIYAVQDYLNNGKHTEWYNQHGVESPFAYGEEPSDKEATPVWIE